MRTLLLTNTDGKPSYSLTLAIVAFCLTATWFVLGGIFQVPHVRSFDAPSALAFLTPCLGLYWGRQHTTSNSQENP